MAELIVKQVWDSPEVTPLADHKLALFTGDGASSAHIKPQALITNFESIKSIEYFGGGVDKTATQNDTAFQDAADSEYKIIGMKQGVYLKSATILLNQAGKIFLGMGGGRFSLNNTTVRMEVVHTWAFQQLSTSTEGLDGCSFLNFNLISDRGIMLNDPTTQIYTGGNSPYLMGSKIKGMYFKPLNYGVANTIAISMSKGFDFFIDEGNVFDNLGISVILQGCDLGRVADNRITNINLYGIYEASVGTYGSTNMIYHNDMVNCTNAGATFIKSSGRFPRIIHNYMEQSSGVCSGFIDISDIGAPVYGLNEATQLSMAVFVDQNRIDGQSFSNDFIYRLKINLPYTQKVIIRDDLTAGPTPTLPWLTIDGGQTLPVRTHIEHPGNYINYDLEGGSQENGINVFNNFKTIGLIKTDQSIVFTPECLKSFSKQLNRDHAADHLEYSPYGLLIKQSLGADYAIFIPPEEDVINAWAKAGNDYEITICARTVTGTQILRLQPIKNNGGVPTHITPTLTEQFDYYTITMTGADINTNVGIGLLLNDGATPTSDIILRTITFKKV